MTDFEINQPRKLAREIVDNFFYELSHTVFGPQINFSHVPSKEVVKLIDHITHIIVWALTGKGAPYKQ